MNLARMTCLLCWLLVPAAGGAETAARVIKVLPHYLDLEGRHALTPSFFDRDAYQAQLRRHPEQRGGLRFDVLWRAPARTPLTLRVELRGTRGGEKTTATLAADVRRRGWYRQWTALQLRGQDYERFGELVAWRVWLEDNGRVVAESKSYLW